MTQRQLASALFAVVGLFIAINWFPQVVLAIGLYGPMEPNADQQPPAAYAITLFVGSLIAVLLGLTLVVLRERLAQRLFAADTGAFAGRELQAVALSVLGCYFAIGAIARLVTVSRFSVSRIQWFAVVELALGVGLFFGARGIARFWAAARSARFSSSDERAV